MENAKLTACLVIWAGCVFVTGFYLWAAIAVTVFGYEPSRQMVAVAAFSGATMGMLYGARVILERAELHVKDKAPAVSSEGQ